MAIKQKLTFWICAKSTDQDIDLNYLAKELQITPCIMRKTYSYPEISVRRGYAKDSLEFSILRYNLHLSSQMVDLLQKKLKNKVQKINELIAELDMETGIVISVEKNSDEDVVMDLSKDNIHFLSSIDAEFCMRVYDMDR